MKILIIDKQPLLRKGIIQVLSSVPGDRIYIEAKSIEEGLEKNNKAVADVIFIELNLGDGSGLDFIEENKNKQRQKYFILADSMNMFEFRRSKELDVDAYILKDSDGEDIKYAFNRVMKGEKYYPQELVEKALSYKEGGALRLLTEREMDVLIELSKGLTNSQIGDNLYIAEGTAKKHISNILNKLNMNNRMEVLVYANKLVAGQ